MDKYLVTEIPANQHVVIDAPDGCLHVTGHVDDEFGNGKIMFVRDSESGGIPLLQMNIRNPERARGIAAAFNELAGLMENWLGEEECDDGCDDPDGEDEPHDEPLYYEFTYEEYPFDTDDE